MQSRRFTQTARGLLSKVVVTAQPFESTLAVLRPAAATVVHNERFEPWKPEELGGQAADAEALLCFMTDTVDAALLDKCPRLRLVACALKGYDNFDLAACAARGVAA